MNSYIITKKNSKRNIKRFLKIKKKWKKCNMSEWKNQAVGKPKKFWKMKKTC